jgi:hypothetical protein
MGPFAFHIFGIFAILAVAWVLFFLWLIGMVVRGLWIGVMRLGGVARPPRSRRAGTFPRRCTRLRCLTENPPQANFCRRCGAPLVRAANRRDSARSNSSRWVSSMSRS